MKIWTTDELYPPASPEEVSAILAATWSKTKDEGGRTLIQRPLTSEERHILRRRKDELTTPWLRKANYHELHAVVLELFGRFPAFKATGDAVTAMAQKYAYAIGDLTAWSVKRAADRFANGNVDAAEIGAKRIDPSQPPSASALHTVAREIARPIMAEFSHISAVLSGEPAQVVQTDEERQRTAGRIAAAHDDFKRRMGQESHEEPDDAARKASWNLQARSRALASIRRDYVQAGVVPPDGDTITSLPMMLKCGWTIQKIGNSNVLVAPKVEVRPQGKRPAKYNEMGS